MGMVEAGEDTGFIQVSLDVLGLGDTLGAWHFDRNRAVEIIIKGLIDLPESTRAKVSEDGVTPDLAGMKEGIGAGRALIGGSQALS
jgi:hypothetical protein